MPFSLKTYKGNEIDGRREKNLHQLKKAEEMPELENCHFTTLL